MFSLPAFVSFFNSRISYLVENDTANTALIPLTEDKQLSLRNFFFVFFLNNFLFLKLKSSPWKSNISI